MLAELIDLCLLFHLSNFCVFFCFVRYLDALPREFPSQKIKEKIAQRLQIVSTTLLKAFVRSNAGVPGCAYKTFSTFYWNMLVCFRIKIPLRQSEVNDINCLSLISSPYHEIVGFDVSMNKTFAMDLLQAGYYLNTNVISAADGKSFAAMSPDKYQI